MKHATKMKLGLGLILAVGLIAGYYGCGGSSSSDDSGSSAPLFSTGVLDTTFDTDGIVTTTIGSASYANAVAIQPDGKIVIAGYSNTSSDDFTLARYNTNGTLDTTFDTDGVVTTTIGSDAYAYAMALQPDGKIVIAGYSDSGVSIVFALARYNTNGTLDTTFDTDGVVTTTIGSGAYANAVALQPDGKIVAAGYFYNGADIDIALVRYDVNGSLDTTFDTDGVVTTTISSGGSDYAYAIALQPDGKILIAGLSDTTGNYSFTIVRYNTNGSLDTAFDTDGVVTTTIGSSNAESYTMALQPDGKIVIAGYSYSGVSDIFTLARYNTNGALDTTFDTDGIVTTTIGILSYARAIAVQADGKIVVAGYAYNGLYDDSTLARYNTNGTLDTGFDTDGIITTTIGSSYSYAKAVAVQADGKIVAAGYAENGVNAGFAVARYWR